MISLSRRKLKWQLKPYGSLPPSPFIGYQELFFRHLSCHLLHLWEQNENKGAQIGWPAKNNCRKNGPKTHPGGKPQNHPHLPLEVSTTSWHLPTGGSVVMQRTQEMWVWSLGWEDFMKEEMATHSSILAWIIPRAEEAAVHGVAKSQTWRNGANTHTHTFTRIKSCATAATDFQHSLNGAQGGEWKWSTLCSRGKNWQDRSSDTWIFSGVDFMSPILVSPLI